MGGGEEEVGGGGEGVEGWQEDGRQEEVGRGEEEVGGGIQKVGGHLQEVDRFVGEAAGRVVINYGVLTRITLGKRFPNCSSRLSLIIFILR